jgi:hypothetical protein
MPDSPFLRKKTAATRAASKLAATTVTPRSIAAKSTTGRSAELHAAMLSDLKRSGLTADDARVMRLTPYDRGELADIKPEGAGYRIPYFSRDGRPLDTMYRYRFIEDTRRKGFSQLSGSKQRRYSQPAGTPPEIYWPPFTDWEMIAADPTVPLIVTEGEKKSALTTKMGAPCIGLGGVWSFRAKSLGMRLLPVLQTVTWEGRTVFIAYDSDAVMNKDVCLAETKLAEELTRLGAIIKLIRLPELVAGQKCGLDDYLVSEGMDRFVSLCEGTELYSLSRELHKMNSEVLYVQNPGVVIVRTTHQPVRAHDFVAHRYADRQYTRTISGPKGMPKMEIRQTAPDWLKWPQRATATKFVFDPSQDEITTDGAFNFWKGWPYAPVRGSVKPWTELLDYIFRDADPGVRKYAEQWMAYPIQHPGVKLRNAVAVWGLKKGTGKSLIGYTLGDLYGEAFAEVNDKQLLGQTPFNEWAKHRHFVMGDEITGTDSREVANSIKYMITREAVEINSKNVPQYSVRDCINYYFTAQHPDCFYLEEDDRRLLIHEVRGAPLAQEFYREFDAWRRSKEGRQALMWHLLYGVDTNEFDPTERPPDTQAKVDMVSHTRTELEDWLIGMRSEPDILCGKFKSDLVAVSEISMLYEAESGKKLGPPLLARKLKELGIGVLWPKGLVTNQLCINGKLYRLTALRNREKWEKASSEQLRSEFERTRGIAAVKKKF